MDLPRPRSFIAQAAVRRFAIDLSGIDNCDGDRHLNVVLSRRKQIIRTEQPDRDSSDKGPAGVALCPPFAGKQSLYLLTAVMMAE
jgi:hypothetical protein